MRWGRQLTEGPRGRTVDRGVATRVFTPQHAPEPTGDSRSDAVRPKAVRRLRRLEATDLPQRGYSPRGSAACRSSSLGRGDGQPAMRTQLGRHRRSVTCDNCRGRGRMGQNEEVWGRPGARESGSPGMKLSVARRGYQRRCRGLHGFAARDEVGSLAGILLSPTDSPTPPDDPSESREHTVPARGPFLLTASRRKGKTLTGLT